APAQGDKDFRLTASAGGFGGADHGVIADQHQGGGDEVGGGEDHDGHVAVEEAVVGPEGPLGAGDPPGGGGDPGGPVGLIGGDDGGSHLQDLGEAEDRTQGEPSGGQSEGDQEQHPGQAAPQRWSQTAPGPVQGPHHHGVEDHHQAGRDRGGPQSRLEEVGGPGRSGDPPDGGQGGGDTGGVARPHQLDDLRDQGQSGQDGCPDQGDIGQGLGHQIPRPARSSAVRAAGSPSSSTRAA